jgi:hypothetical protein
MNTEKQQADSTSNWFRIPNGTKVRHRHEAYDGVIDGLTEIVEGSQRNPDGKTQYRVNIGPGSRQLVSEDNLSILLDSENLVIIGREKEPYRRSVTTHLRAAFTEDRFIKSA